MPLAPANAKVASGLLQGANGEGTFGFSEVIRIESVLHIVAQVRDTETTIHVNVQRSTAIGQTTGDRYSFHGMDKIVIPGPPPTGTRVAPTQITLRNAPSSNNNLVPVDLVLTFNSAGELTGATASFPSTRT